MLYYTCVIYANTSLFLGQLADGRSKLRIATSVTYILLLANTIINLGRVDTRFMIFPLFIAGFAVSENLLKQLALHIIKIVEQSRFGGCIQGVRIFLEEIYQQQYTAAPGDSRPSSVDWVQEMERQGQLIIYGI
jgi:hypothetical protein